MKNLSFFLLALTLSGCAGAPPSPKDFGTAPEVRDVRCEGAMLHIGAKARLLFGGQGLSSEAFSARLCGGGPNSLRPTWGVRKAECEGVLCERYPGYGDGVVRGVEWERVGKGSRPNQARLFFAEYADGSVSALLFFTPSEEWYTEFTPVIAERLPVLVEEYDPAGHLASFHRQETVMQGYPVKEAPAESSPRSRESRKVNRPNPTPWGRDSPKMARAIRACHNSGGSRCTLPH